MISRTITKEVDGQQFRVKQVFSEKAIDYDAGLDIYDPLTEVTYTEEQANALDHAIKGRLINKPRKTGAWVDDAQDEGYRAWFNYKNKLGEHKDERYKKIGFKACHEGAGIHCTGAKIYYKGKEIGTVIDYDPNSFFATASIDDNAITKKTPESISISFEGTHNVTFEDNKLGDEE